jgi:photosystem II stability/assembly factor-like uncharacterized protein
MRTSLSAIALCGAVVAALTGCGTQQAPFQPQARSSHAQPPTHALVRAAQLVQGQTGWALSNKALFMTANGGRAWAVITPPGVPVRTIRGAYFLGTRRGWAVSVSPRHPMQLEMSTTTDGGKSWSTAPLGGRSWFAAGSAGVPAYIDFVDARHGWVVAMIASGAGVLPQGVLFRTSNGGASWQQLPMPVGGPVEFTTASTGWLVDGIQGERAPRFYVTADGGQHWTAKTVPPPPGFTRGQAAYSIPAFTTPANVILAAYDNGNRSTAGFYQTSDAGLTWHRTATVPAGNPAGDVSPSAAVIDPARWIAVAVNGASITKVTQDGAHQVSVSPAGLPPGGGGQPSFANSTTGWVITDTFRCVGFKCDQQYTETIGLYLTTDGGAHWKAMMSARLGP